MKMIRFVVFLCVSMAVSCGAKSLNGTLKTAEIEALLEVLGPNPKEPYLQEESFLKNWLESYENDLSDAEINLKNFLKWREEVDLQTLASQNWDDMRTKFPFTLDTTDKNGNPVLYYDFGEWDIASCLSEEGCASRLENYIIIILSKIGYARVRELQSAGVPATKTVHVVNLAGFTQSKHACVQCLLYYRKVSSNPGHQFHMKAYVKESILINAPTLFKLAFDFFSPNLQSFVTLYGYNSDIWKDALLQRMEYNQFPNGVLAEIDNAAKDNSDGLLQWQKEL